MHGDKIKIRNFVAVSLLLFLYCLLYHFSIRLSFLRPLLNESVPTLDCEAFLYPV
jgi:hypothetical protein